jgi:hypothetical protein
MQPSTPQVGQVQPNDPVVGLQAQLLQPVEDPGGDPLITPAADRGRRAAGVGELVVGRPEHQSLDELVEHHPIRDPWPVTAQGVDDHTLGKQPGELAPQRVDDRRWQRRHKHLVGEETSLDNP